MTDVDAAEQVLRYAEYVFVDWKTAEAWIRTPHPELGNDAPLRPVAIG